MKKKKIPYGAPVSVKLSFHERDLIRDETLCDPDFARFAIVDSTSIRLELSLDEIEEIQGYVAAEANHTEKKTLQSKRDRLFKKLQTYLDTYDDQSE